MKKTVLAITALAVALAASCGGKGDTPKTRGAGTADTVEMSFTDSRDGKAYKIVKIGTQTWMGENLNFKTDSSKCYYDSSSYCAKYGRLYNWNDALTACPAGWHLPTDAEWDTLADFVGGKDTAGMNLKSKTGWSNDPYRDISGNGTDKYGFSALPGGSSSPRGYYSDGIFLGVGYDGSWWSATENVANSAVWGRHMNCFKDVFRITAYETNLFSVRCVRD